MGLSLHMCELIVLVYDMTNYLLHMMPNDAHLLNAYDAKCTCLLNAYDAKLHQVYSITLEAYSFEINWCSTPSDGESVNR